MQKRKQISFLITSAGVKLQIVVLCFLLSNNQLKAQQFIADSTLVYIGDTVTSASDIINNGRINLGTNSNFYFKGSNWIQKNNTTTSGDGILIFAGDNTQKVFGKGSFSNILVKNINGVSLYNDIIINNSLNLAAGNFDASNNIINFADSSSITRTGGSLPSIPYFSGHVNINYPSYSFPLTASNEMPANSQLVNNLLINNIKGISFNSNVFVTGNIDGAGKIILNGNSLQAIGALGGTFNTGNILISNNQNILLTSPLTVAGNITMAKGKFFIGDNIVHLSNAGNVIGADSTKYLVTNTSLSKLKISNINTERIFPVGTSDFYLPVTINPTGTGDYMASVFEGATEDGQVNGTPMPDYSRMVNAVWNVERINGNGTANVKVEWNKNLEGKFFGSLKDTSIALHEYDGTQWVKTQQPNSTNISNRYAQGNFDNFNAFVVKYKDYTNSKEILRVYPMPVTSASVIQVESKIKGKHVLELYSSTGQILWQANYDLIEGINEIKWPAPMIARGIYVLTKDRKQSIKIIVN